MNGLPSGAASISRLLLAATEIINVAKARLGHAKLRALRFKLSRTSDIGVGGGNDNVNAWPRDVQCIDGHRSGVSTR